MNEEEVKERGLTFCQELVPRVLDGSKFVTRRLGGLNEINENPDIWKPAGMNKFNQWIFWGPDEDDVRLIRCPQGVAGDRFYMREAWGLLYPGYHVFNHCAAIYDAWNKTVEESANQPYSVKPLIPLYKTEHVHDGRDCEFGKVRWRSGRFQPKWACRPQRWELINIRPERIQEITEEEIIAEGIRPMGHCEGDRVKILMRLSGKYPPCEYLNKAQDNILEAHFISTWNVLNAKRGFPFERNNWVWREEWNPEPVSN